MLLLITIASFVAIFLIVALLVYFIYPKTAKWLQGVALEEAAQPAEKPLGEGHPA